MSFPELPQELRLGPWKTQTITKIKFTLEGVALANFFAKLNTCARKRAEVGIFFDLCIDTVNQRFLIVNDPMGEIFDTSNMSFHDSITANCYKVTCRLSQNDYIQTANQMTSCQFSLTHYRTGTMTSMTALDEHIDLKINNCCFQIN